MWEKQYKIGLLVENPLHMVWGTSAEEASSFNQRMKKCWFAVLIRYGMKDTCLGAAIQL